MDFGFLSTYIIINELISFCENSELLFQYLIFISIITFILFALDKIRATRKQWRIPEAVLLGFSFVGGGLGAFLAMKIFRHKTKKSKFSFGIPLMLLVQIGVIIYILAN